MFVTRISLIWNSLDSGSTPHKVSVYTVQNYAEKWGKLYIDIQSGVSDPRSQFWSTRRRSRGCVALVICQTWPHCNKSKAGSASHIRPCTSYWLFYNYFLVAMKMVKNYVVAYWCTSFSIKCCWSYRLTPTHLSIKLIKIYSLQKIFTNYITSKFLKVLQYVFRPIWSS